MIRLSAFSLAVATIFGGTLLFSQDKPAPMPKTDSELVLKLVAKTETYKIPAEWRGEKLKEKMAADAFPKPPAVDLELQITNKGAAEKSLRLDSDAGRLVLDLKGPGAVSANARRLFTQEFRIGKVVTVKPGETHTIAWKQLSYGHRGVEYSAYWTEPGEYTLGAKLILPFNAKDISKPEKLELVAEPIKLKAEAQ